MLQHILLLAVVLVFIGCQPSEQKAEAESSVPVGFFGFKKGMTARTVKHLIEEHNSIPPLIFQHGDRIEFTFSSTPEKYHNYDFFETCLLEVSKEVGLYSVRAFSKISGLDLFYDGIPEDGLKTLALIQYTELKIVLKRDYGEYTEHDFLKSDSIFDGDSIKDWVEGLHQRERVLLSYWKNDRLSEAGIRLIILRVTAFNGSYPNVNIDVIMVFTNLPEGESSEEKWLKKVESYDR